MPQPIKIKGVEIHPAVLPLILFAFLFDFANYLALAYLSVIIHELAHAAAATALGIKLEKTEVLPFGVTIKLCGAYIKKPVHEIIIAAAGPICSGCLALLFYNSDPDSFLAAVNAAVAAVNIVPALPLDGGRILRAVLTECWGYVKSFNYTLRITRLCAVMLTLAGAALLIYTKFNFSLILIGAFLIVNTIAEQRGRIHVMMDEILRSREKLANGSAERVGTIAISADEPARKALKLLSYNRYYLISVIDRNMRVIGTVTETELIESLVKDGVRIKAGKMVDLYN